MILFHAADLLWATKIKTTADALHIPARPVRSLDMLHARLADSPVRALIVDLDAPETALSFIHHLRSLAQALQGYGVASLPPRQPSNTHQTVSTPLPAHPFRILAFGPHVAVETLRLAKEAGADTVLSRGAFHARLPHYLRLLADDLSASPIPDAIED